MSPPLHAHPPSPRIPASSPLNLPVPAPRCSMPPSPANPQIWCEDGLPPTRAQAPGFFSELKEVRYDMMVNSSLNHRFSPLEGAQKLQRRGQAGRYGMASETCLCSGNSQLL